MAKYDISPEGADNLRELAVKLATSIDNISCANTALKNSINYWKDGLGIYYEDISTLAENVSDKVEQAKKGENGVDSCIRIINRLYLQTEKLVLMGLKSMESDDDEDAPVRKLTLKR